MAENVKDVYEGSFKEGGTFIRWIKKPKLKNPVFIQGLPGIGYVGRNAAGYLVDELGAEKFAEMYSYHFPHVVLVDPNKKGLIRELKLEFFFWKAKKKGQRDLVILIGDAQSMDPKGHYLIAEKIVDVIESLGVKEIITLGGFGTGELVEDEPKVYGATVREENMAPFEKLGVKFKDTAIGQIIGAAGLVLAVAKHRKMGGVCLMGETSGMLVSDPKATEAVLKVLDGYLNLGLDFSKIEERVKELDKIMKKIENLQEQLLSSLMQQQTRRGEKKSEEKDLQYIG